MKNKRNLILMILLIILILGGSYFLYQRLSVKVTPDPTKTTSVSPSKAETSASSKRAPDFTVYDAKGNKVTLSSTRGKPVVVNFWASWCDPCQSELPSYQEAYQRYGKDVYFMMVDLTGGGGDSMADAQKLISKNGFSFPVYYDNDNDATVKYNIRSIPLSCFITADGILKDTHLGAISQDDLVKEIKALLPTK